MIANVKENVVSCSLSEAFVDGIGVSVSNPNLSVFDCDMVFSRFF